MLHNSISVDMKVYAPQLKHKKRPEFCEILEQLLKQQVKDLTMNDPCSFKFSLFPGQLFISHETISFLRKFSHSGAF